MKHLVILLFVLSFNSGYSQSRSSKIYRTWIVKKLTYKDGSELPDDHPLKYTYLKYTFTSPNRFSSSLAYFETGTERSFDIKENELRLKSVDGVVINIERIEQQDDKLILLQAGNDGYDDPKSLLFTFIPEMEFQDLLPLKSADIHSIHKGDTTYNESPKIYATYNGESFQRYIYKGISNSIKMDKRAEKLIATFLVSKNGLADSVELLETVDAEFDKRFIKVFNQAKKDWKPAILNGKPVNVRMRVELRYSTVDISMGAYFAAQKGLTALHNKDYEAAEYFYGEAIKSDPKDRNLFYNRGICKLLLGNKAGACEDWNKAKLLGSSSEIEAVLEKYCN